MISKTILHYNILEIIGEGGMGIVYKARDLHLDRLVALKFLPPTLTSDEKAAEQFIHEARAAAQLDHPNICTIHEFEKIDDDQFVIVMAYCHGETLSHLLSENGRLPIEQFLDMSIQIAQGMGRAHKEGIIHRDIKPANIIINHEGVVKILDFGLAGLKEDISRTDGLTMPGTITYMSPEQTIGNNVDHRSDIWSLGVMMYEMLSGQKPFNGEHEQSQIYSILKDPPPALHTLRDALPGRVEEIIHKCLQKETDQRYQRADEIVKELEEIRNKEISPTTSIEHRKNKHIWQIVIVSFLFLTLVATYLFFPQSEPDDGKIRIAVMPFENQGPDQEEKWLCDVITQEIRTKLSKISLFTILSNSIWNDSTLLVASLFNIGDRLNLDFIVGGSVLKYNHHLSIRVHLSDPHTEAQVWGETYDRETTQIIATMGEIAGKITSELHLELTSSEEDRISELPTYDELALRYYLKGLDNYQKSIPETNETAIRLYKEALKIDPEYALPYVGLCNSYFFRVMGYGYSLAWYDSAFSMMNKALRIDPDCSEAYLAKGRLYDQDIYMGPDSLPAAFAAFEKAIELNPNNYFAYKRMGRLKLDVGLLEEALSYFKEALKLNPVADDVYGSLAWTYYLLGDRQKAIEHYHEAYKIAPEYPYDMLGIYIQEEHYEKVLALYEERLRIRPDWQWLKHDKAVILNNAGQYEQSIKLFEELTQEYPNQIWHHIGLANVHAGMGLYDKAINVYTRHEEILDTCSICSPSIIIDFNHSLLLKKMNRVKLAKKVISDALKNPEMKLYTFHESMLRIIDFYQGKIDTDSIEQIISKASQKLQRQSYFNSHYFYLGLAYLYNLKPGYILTPAHREKAIAHLKRYESKAIKHDVEFSLAQAELKHLNALN